MQEAKHWHVARISVPACSVVSKLRLRHTAADTCQIVMFFASIPSPTCCFGMQSCSCTESFFSWWLKFLKRAVVYILGNHRILYTHIIPQEAIYYAYHISSSSTHGGLLLGWTPGTAACSRNRCPRSEFEAPLVARSRVRGPSGLFRLGFCARCNSCFRSYRVGDLLSHAAFELSRGMNTSTTVRVRHFTSSYWASSACIPGSHDARDIRPLNVTTG